MRPVALACLAILLVACGAEANERLPVTIRGKTLTLELYGPSSGSTPKGTVLMGSGDVGWVGLGVELSELLSKEGYFVVGINVRQYLASFTSGAIHVTTDQVAADFGEIIQLLRDRRRLAPPVVVAGVSEGAALAVLAGSAPANHAWLTGVITMGLPRTAELAWRWSDAASWITRRDADEPSFEPAPFVGRVSPVPLWMIQSTKDEYVTEADYRRFESLARPPRRLVLIDASNHRFTDRRPQLWQQFLAGLAWFRDPR